MLEASTWMINMVLERKDKKKSGRGENFVGPCLCQKTCRPINVDPKAGLLFIPISIRIYHSPHIAAVLRVYSTVSPITS